MEITLEQLLLSREERQGIQRELLDSHPGKTLLCLTVIAPGNVKRTTDSLVAANAALCELTVSFPGNPLVLRDLPTGFEAYMTVDMPPLEAKRKTCSIEETHPLGRLFDIDVIGSDGIPVERREVSMEPRKCLLCDNEARICMRAGSHSPQELLSRIHDMVNAYV